MRLYVDCDMTLVLWQDGMEHPWNGAEKFKRNQPLIDAIHEFLRIYPTTGLTIWSGGGMSYAQQWAREFNLPATAVMAKDPHVPSAGDICVDDQPLKVEARLMTPEEFIEMVERTAERDKIHMRAAKDDTATMFKGVFEEVKD